MISTRQKGTAGVLTLGLVLAGCADGGAVLAAPAPDPLGEPQRYTTSAFIIQQGDEPPELCLSTVMESNPPQCGGPTVVGLDWADVPDAETVMGVTFGSAWVVGTYADETFTLTEPVSSDPPAGHAPPGSTPPTYSPPSGDAPSAEDGEAAMSTLGEHATEVGLLVWSPDPTTGRFSADVIRLDASTEARIHEILAPWYEADQIDLYSRLEPLS